MRKTILLVPALALLAACGSASVTHAPKATATKTVSGLASVPGVTGCSPMTRKGKCYSPGDECSSVDHRVFGLDADGKVITCKDVKGTWRWELS